MPITEEIRQAAEELGKHLNVESSVQEFVRLNEKTQQDTEVLELESKLARLYQILIERQQNGDVLEQVEIDEYYRLKHQVQNQPLIVARNTCLENVKALFDQTAQRMTSMLGIEYTTFAK